MIENDAELVWDELREHYVLAFRTPPAASSIGGTCIIHVAKSFMRDDECVRRALNQRSIPVTIRDTEEGLKLELSFFGRGGVEHNTWGRCVAGLSLLLRYLRPTYTVIATRPLSEREGHRARAAIFQSFMTPVIELAKASSGFGPRTQLTFRDVKGKEPYQWVAEGCEDVPWSISIESTLSEVAFHYDDQGDIHCEAVLRVPESVGVPHSRLYPIRFRDVGNDLERLYMLFSKSTEPSYVENL